MGKGTTRRRVRGGEGTTRRRVRGGEGHDTEEGTGRRLENGNDRGGGPYGRGTFEGTGEATQHSKLSPTVNTCPDETRGRNSRGVDQGTRVDV